MGSSQCYRWCENSRMVVSPNQFMNVTGQALMSNCVTCTANSSVTVMLFYIHFPPQLCGCGEFRTDSRPSSGFQSLRSFLCLALSTSDSCKLNVAAHLSSREGLVVSSSLQTSLPLQFLGALKKSTVGSFVIPFASSFPSRFEGTSLCLSLHYERYLVSSPPC